MKNYQAYCKTCNCPLSSGKYKNIKDLVKILREQGILNKVDYVTASNRLKSWRYTASYLYSHG